MRFCVISPIAGLKRYATLSRTHLLLPQLDKHPEYRRFYQERRQNGDLLILDNGAYEGQTDWKALLDCISIYNPQVCALPDYLLQSWEKTHHEALLFLDRYHDAFPNVQWMYVPQAVPGDIMGYLDGLYRAIEDPRITWIGLSRALPLQVTEDPLMRVNLATQLRKRWGGKIHALGMMKGSVAELNKLREAGVYTIDSNAPVWRGMCGWDISANSWPEISVRYEDPCVLPDKIFYRGGQSKHELILNNLEACGVDTSSVREGNRVSGENVAGGEDDKGVGEPLPKA